MKTAKPAISAYFESQHIELTLENIKDMEQHIEQLKNYCLNEEIIQAALIDSKRNSDGNVCCPYCGSDKIKKNGHNRHHKQVYCCLEKDCDCKSFTDSSNSILSSSKKDTSIWISYIKAYLDQCTLKVCADKAHISENTAFFWRQKLNYFFSQLLNKTVLCGEIQLDETFSNDVNIGKNNECAIQNKKRGISNDKVNIATAIDSNGKMVLKTSVNGRITSKALIEAFSGLIKEKATVISDSQRSYHKFMKAMNINWVKIDSGKKEKDGYTLNAVNRLHDAIQTFLGSFRGVIKRYLQGYLGYFYLLRIHKLYYHDDVFEHILQTLFSTSGKLRYRDILDKKPIYA